MTMGTIVYVTGTDTGVGKTLLTSLLLVHLRRQGFHVLAMKPFCSGGIGDVKTLRRAMDNEIPIELICPFQFTEPVAPLLAARLERRQIDLQDVLERMRSLAAQCEILLVEGAGGLLAPLGDQYSLADCIKATDSPVVVVASNRLGAINHTMLTLQAARALGVQHVAIVLTDTRRTTDLARQHNQSIIEELAAPVAVIHLPFLGPNASALSRLKLNERKLQKTLALLCLQGIFSLTFRKDSKTRKIAKRTCAE
jgi:dethiobiotin synthetase